MDETRQINEITVGEFRSLIREIVTDVVQEILFEFEQQLPDPDEGFELRVEIQERLKKSLEQNGELHTLEDVQRELDLDG